MKIDLIAGARPNFVKIAALLHANQFLNSPIDYRLIHTGQHYDESLSGNFFKQLNIPEPQINLKIGSGTQAEQTAGIMVAYEKSLQNYRPEICVVVGDVTSSMACAITAKKMGVKVAHIEAGIRSHDWSMPEEINRVIIDSISDYFFTTTKAASDLLINQGKKIDQVYFVGNIMIDSLLNFKSKFKKPDIWNRLSLENNNYFLLTLHRPGNVDDVENLNRLLQEIHDQANGLPIIFPAHPRTVEKVRTLPIKLKNLHIIEPLGYLQFNFLLERSRAVITDSGGITEEATVLNIPCMTFRNNTERPETVSEGTNLLLGTDPKAIAPAFALLNSGRWKQGVIPYKWDGKTGERIIQILTREVTQKNAF